MIATATLAWSTRVAFILRYERLYKTKLIAVRSGASWFDIREVRILKSPRAAFPPS